MSRSGLKPLSLWLLLPTLILAIGLTFSLTTFWLSKMQLREVVIHEERQSALLEAHRLRAFLDATLQREDASSSQTVNPRQHPYKCC